MDLSAYPQQVDGAAVAAKEACGYGALDFKFHQPSRTVVQFSWSCEQVFWIFGWFLGIWILGYWQRNFSLGN